MAKNSGFSLIELIAVLLIIGILAGAGTASLLPSATFQMQSSRDQVVTAFFAAQQRAMTQASPVRFSVVSPNQLDIREDTDGDGDFSDESSLSFNGIRYPIELLPNQTLTPSSFNFDRLGKTTAQTLTLTQGSDTVAITISANGYIN